MTDEKIIERVATETALAEQRNERRGRPTHDTWIAADQIAGANRVRSIAPRLARLAREGRLVRQHDFAEQRNKYRVAT
jgi:hypothetical protein